MPSPDGLRFAIVSPPVGQFSIILIHALGHQSDAQPESQDEIFPCHGAVDFVLCADEGIECLLLCSATRFLRKADRINEKK
jgi:hypothetical protein